MQKLNAPACDIDNLIQISPYAVIYVFRMIITILGFPNRLCFLSLSQISSVHSCLHLWANSSGEKANPIQNCQNTKIRHP